MFDFKDRSDTAVLQELGRRLAQYRLNKNMSQRALAKEVGVSSLTIHRVEHGHAIQTLNLIRVARGLNLLENLAAFIPEPAISPIQQAKMQGKKRQRASSPAQVAESKEPWSWQDEE